MNSPVQLLERLLMLYPTKALKSHFTSLDTTTQAEQIPEIVSKYPEGAIMDFAMEYIGLSKQHTYVYQLGANFNSARFVRENFPIPIKNTFQQDGNYSFLCFPIVEYTVLLTDPSEQVTVQFMQPTRIVANGRSLVIQTTIMERKASHYLSVDGNRKVFDIGRRNTEEEFIPAVISHLKQSYHLESCDLNRGVKRLWENGVIDCKSIKYKKDKSTSTESMDEQYTLREHMPEVYRDAMTRPLNKTLFRYLRDDNAFSRHFVVDPTAGLLSMAVSSP